MKNLKISIIGAGGWGTALALQALKSHPVVLWSYSEEETKLFREKKENIYYLPGISLPDSLEITNDKELAASGDILIFVSPSAFFRKVVRGFEGLIKSDQILVSATKGFEYPGHTLMTEIIKDSFSFSDNICVLSGPSHAEEVARDIPSSVVVASSNQDAAETVQAALSNSRFRLYTNSDSRGVQIAGALKNVIAVAAGMLRGLGFGDNTMAMLITRGLAEIRRIGLSMGAQPETFAGLAGIGDLIVTCMSHHSRNGRLGEALSHGMSLAEYNASTRMVAEGAETVKSAVLLQKEFGQELPISQAVYEVLYQGKSALEVLQGLMDRPLRNEWE